MNEVRVNEHVFKLGTAVGVRFEMGDGSIARVSISYEVPVSELMTMAKGLQEAVSAAAQQAYAEQVEARLRFLDSLERGSPQVIGGPPQVIGGPPQVIGG